MINRLVQWLLSKLFPYNDATMAREPIGSTHDYGWDKLKLHESKDSTGRY